MTVINPFFPMEEDLPLPIESQSLNEYLTNDPSLHEALTKKYPSPPQTSLKSKKHSFLSLFVIPFSAIIVLVVILPNSTWIKNITSDYNPHFHIEFFRLSSFDITSSKLSAANWKIDFSTKNPSNVTTYFYDNIVASIYYGKKLLAVTMVEQFYQQPRDKTFIRATFGQSEVTVEDWAARAISRNQKHYESLPFNVMVRARVKVDPGKLSERTFQLKVLCNDVYVMLDDDWWKSGLMQGGPKKCNDEWTVDKGLV